MYSKNSNVLTNYRIIPATLRFIPILFICQMLNRPFYIISLPNKKLAETGFVKHNMIRGEELPWRQMPFSTIISEKKQIIV